MHLRIFFLTLVFWGLPFFAYGGTVREVELIDGSIIRAEMLSMDGKMYRLRSDALGTIEVPESQVKAIRSPGESLVHPQTAEELTFGSSTSPLATPVPTPSANGLQQALSQNPAAMNKIISLQNDPLMQQILGDDFMLEGFLSDLEKQYDACFGRSGGEMCIAQRQRDYFQS